MGYPKHRVPTAGFRFIAAEAAGVEVMCWFSAQDTVDGPWGLTANDGRGRRSYYAFKTMSEQLGDYVLVRQVAGALNLTSGVQAFLFRGPAITSWRYGA